METPFSLAAEPKKGSNMSITRKMEEGSFTHIDPGTYPVICTAVQEDHLDNSQFGSGDVIRFSLRFTNVYDEEGNEVERDAIANDKLTPMSKLTGWLFAFGVSTAIGESVNIEECVGKHALAKVGERVKDDRTYDRIEELLPAIAAPSTSDDIAEMEIGDWWQLVRSQGFERARAMEVTAEMFGAGKEPKDLTGKEREAVFAAL